MVKAAFHRVKVPIAGVIGIVLVTLIAFAVVRPEALMVKKSPSWTITGNVVLDNSLFDAKIDQQKPCTDFYDPVCGVDGKSYENLCYALKVGVDMSHRGVCD